MFCISLTHTIKSIGDFESYNSNKKGMERFLFLLNEDHSPTFVVSTRSCYAELPYSSLTGNVYSYSLIR